MTESNPTHNKDPNHKVLIKPITQTVSAHYKGLLLAKTDRALLVQETAHTDVIYLPIADMQMELLEKTTHSTFCPYKGNASYWSLRTDDTVEENVLWAYLEPLSEANELRGYGAFYQDRITVEISDS